MANKSSRKTTYWIIGAIIGIIIILGIGYKAVKHYQRVAMNSNAANGTTQTASNSNQTAQHGSGTTGSAATPGNTNNAQLDQDVNTIQGNLNQLSTDQGNANQSLQSQSNDTPQQ